MVTTDEKWYNNIDGYYAAAKELFETGNYNTLLQQKGILLPDGKPDAGFDAWAKATRKGTV